MNNKIINKLLKFLERKFIFTVKKDFNWLRKTIIRDLEKLAKQTSKK